MMKRMIIIVIAIIVMGANVAFAAEGDTNFTNVVASGDLTAGDDLTVGDDADIAGDVTIGGTLGITGKLTVDDLDGTGKLHWGTAGTPTVALVDGAGYVYKAFEIDGVLYIDGGSLLRDNIAFTMGTNSDAVLTYDETTTDRVTMTTLAASGFNVLTGNVFIGNGVPIAALDGEDLYVEGTSELTGHVYTKGNVYWVDDGGAYFGADNDAYFWYDETTDDLFKLTIASATGGLQLQVGNLFVGNGSPGQTIDGEDAYIEGLLEVDGVIYGDVGATIPVDQLLTLGIYTIEDDDDGTNYLALTAPAAEGLNLIAGNFVIGTAATAEKVTLDGLNTYLEGELEVDGLAYFDNDTMVNGDFEVNGHVDVEDTRAGGVSNGPVIKKTFTAGETYTGGTTAGLMVKAYDADGTVVHSGGELAGLYVNLKQSVAMTDGGESAVASFHNYPGLVDPDFGLRIFGDFNDSAFQFAAGTSGIAIIDMSLADGPIDIKLQNGETITNDPDGTIDFGSAILTTDGAIDADSDVDIAGALALSGTSGLSVGASGAVLDWSALTGSNAAVGSRVTSDGTGAAVALKGADFRATSTAGTTENVLGLQAIATRSGGAAIAAGVFGANISATHSGGSAISAYGVQGSLSIGASATSTGGLNSVAAGLKGTLYIDTGATVPADVITAGVVSLLDDDTTGNAPKKYDGAFAAQLGGDTHDVDAGAVLVATSINSSGGFFDYGVDFNALNDFAVADFRGVNGEYLHNKTDGFWTTDGGIVAAGNIDINADMDVSGAMTNAGTAVALVGWSIAAGGNTACATTCGAKACYGGMDHATPVLVNCADASADSCFCAP